MIRFIFKKLNEVRKTRSATDLNDLINETNMRDPPLNRAMFARPNFTENQFDLD